MSTATRTHLYVVVTALACVALCAAAAAEAAYVKGERLYRLAGENEDAGQSNEYVKVITRPDGSLQVVYHDPDFGNRLVIREVRSGQALKISYWNNMGIRVPQEVRTAKFVPSAAASSLPSSKVDYAPPAIAVSREPSTKTNYVQPAVAAAPAPQKTDLTPSASLSSSSSTSTANDNAPAIAPSSPAAKSDGAPPTVAEAAQPSNTPTPAPPSSSASASIESAVSPLTPLPSTPALPIAETAVPASAATASLADMSNATSAAAGTTSSGTPSSPSNTSSGTTTTGIASPVESTAVTTTSSPSPAGVDSTVAARPPVSTTPEQFPPTEPFNPVIVPTTPKDSSPSSSSSVPFNPVIVPTTPKTDSGTPGASSTGSKATKPVITPVPIVGENFISTTDSPLGPCVWQKFPVKVFVANCTGANGVQLQSEVKDAFSTWTQATGNKIRFQFVPTTNADIVVTWVTSQAGFSNPKEAGEASVDYHTQGKDKKTLKNPGDITHARIRLMTRAIAGREWRPGELRLVALHEIGHSLGVFGHSTNRNDIMYTDNGAPELSQRDINTVNMLYASVSGQ